LKQEFATKKQQNLRMRFHIKKKLHRALQWAKILQKGCVRHTENKCALDAEAYAEYMAGCYHFEIDSWEMSLDCFVKSRKIYSELIKISDSLLNAIFQEKLDQIDQSIRLCNYKLKRGGEQSIDQLVNLKTSVQDPALMDKIEGLLKEQRQQEIKSTTGLEILYHGLKLPIKNEKVIDLMQQIDKIEKNLDKVDESKMQLEEEKGESNVFNAYIELFSLYDDLIKNVNKDKEESKAVEATAQIYIKISNYFASRKLKRVIERNKLQVKFAIAKFVKESGLDNIWNAKKNLKYRTLGAQDIVKLFDNLLQIYRQLIDIESSNPDFKEIKGFESQELAYKILRVFYVACAHISFGRVLEGYSLLVNLENEYQKLKEYCQNYGIEFKKLNPELDSELADHIDKIGTLKVRGHVLILNQKNKEQDLLKSKIENMTLEEKSQLKLTLDELLKNPQTATDDLQTTIDTIGDVALIEFPPKLTQLPCKPIFLDLGYSYLQYPSMDNKIKVEKKGLLKTMGSFFTRS